MHGPIFLLAWTAALFYQLELSRVRAIHILHVKLDLLMHIPFQVFVRPALLHIADCPCPTTSYDEMMDNMKSFTFLTEDILVAVVASCIHHCISRHEQNRKMSSSTPSRPVDLQGQARNSMPKVASQTSIDQEEKKQKTTTTPFDSPLAHVTSMYQKNNDCFRRLLKSHFCREIKLAVNDFSKGKEAGR